ncbi:MAG: peptidyl-prolyl cis-trans isomerase [Alphaproteobacteria bacterium]|nr:peptidyl-prolyl cis-trans isomerase [Alphaproteobacteria bacterium]
MAEASNRRITDYLLPSAAALGLGAAMWSALGVSDTVAKYDDAIAVVDGVPIARSVYESAVAGLASAKRNPLTDEERREALERIVDEELLLRRAMKLGLPESDPPSRKALVNAMLQLSVADAAKLEPTDEELRTFYAERPKLIAPQPLLTVRAASFDNTDTARIQRLQAALASGQAFEASVKAAGGEPALLPQGPIIPAKVAEYAGASVRDTALGLEPGRTSGPVEIGRRVVFVHLIARLEAPPPPLEEVRAVVIDEWRKRATEKAFEDYLRGLRSTARITYADGVK